MADTALAPSIDLQAPTASSAAMTIAHGVPRRANQTMLPISRPVAWAVQPTSAAARSARMVIDEIGLPLA